MTEPDFQYGPTCEPEAANIALLAEQVSETKEVIVNALGNIRQFWDSTLSSEVLSSLDPCILFRQAQPAFAAAECSGLDDSALIPLISAYAMIKVGPAQLLDSELDGVSHPAVNSGDVSVVPSELRWPLSLVMSTKGHFLVNQLRPSLCRELMIPLIQEMYVCMYKQRRVSIPYDPGRLRAPESILKEYESKHSPEKASIFNRSMWFAGLATGNWNLDEIETTRSIADKFGVQRQRIDELADLYEDLLAGHVTRPLAYALANVDATTRKALIKLVEFEFWKTHTQPAILPRGNTPRNDYVSWLSTRPYVVEARNILGSAGILEHLSGELLSLNQSIGEEIAQTLAHVSHKRLSRINSLKHAFIRRIEKYHWIPHIPPDTPLREIEGLSSN